MLRRLHKSEEVGEMHDPGHVGLGEFDTAGQFKLEAHAQGNSATFCTNGIPYGNGSGTGVVSATAAYNLEKSLFTSPERQSVIGPTVSGYLSVSLRKLKLCS